MSRFDHPEFPRAVQTGTVNPFLKSHSSSSSTGSIVAHGHRTSSSSTTLTISGRIYRARPAREIRCGSGDTTSCAETTIQSRKARCPTSAALYPRAARTELANPECSGRSTSLASLGRMLAAEFLYRWAVTSLAVTHSRLPCHISRRPTVDYRVTISSGTDLEGRVRLNEPALVLL
jgi:hypothetical protein